MLSGAPPFRGQSFDALVRVPCTTPCTAPVHHAIHHAHAPRPRTSPTHLAHAPRTRTSPRTSHTHLAPRTSHTHLAHAPRTRTSHTHLAHAPRTRTSHTHLAHAPRTRTSHTHLAHAPRTRTRTRTSHTHLAHAPRTRTSHTHSHTHLAHAPRTRTSHTHLAPRTTHTHHAHAPRTTHLAHAHAPALAPAPCSASASRALTPGAPSSGEERPRARLLPARRAERARAPAHRWDAPDQPGRPRGRMLHMSIGHTRPARGTTLARARRGPLVSPLGSAAAPGPLGPSWAHVVAPLRGAAQDADAAALASQARARPT